MKKVIISFAIAAMCLCSCCNNNSGNKQAEGEAEATECCEKAEGECCGDCSECTEGETCEGCHDEFLVVVHNTPSLSVLLVSGTRPSRAHIEEGRLPRKT